MADNDFKGVPGGGELWRTEDGKVFLVYYVPEHQPPIPLLYHVPTIEELQAILGPTGTLQVRQTTAADVAKAGGIHAGKSTELANRSEEPFEQFEATFEKESQIRPWLRDPEVLALTVQAILEGRTVTDAELKTTEWWTSRTPEQRRWVEFAAGEGEETVQRALQTNRLQVRDLFVKEGMLAPSERLVAMWADRWTTGEITQAQLQDAVRREVDPTAPGASPFAGFDLPSDAEIVQFGADLYARVGGQDYKLTGPGQIARYVDPGKVRKVDAVVVAGELKDLAVGRQQEILGAEQRVKDLVLRYLGPRYAAGYDEAFVAHWAGQYRRNPDVAEAQLQDMLQRRFDDAFPNRAGTMSTYADLAGLARSEAMRYIGTAPDEHEDWFLKHLDITDPSERVQHLRQQGLNRGWLGPEMVATYEEADAKIGGRVVRPVGV